MCFYFQTCFYFHMWSLLNYYTTRKSFHSTHFLRFLSLHITSNTFTPFIRSITRRDDSIPPVACDLSASQQTVLHYVLNILSTMETVSDDYTDGEIHGNDFKDNNLVSFLLYIFSLLYSWTQFSQYFPYCITIYIYLYNIYINIIYIQYIYIYIYILSLYISLLVLAGKTTR